MKHEGLKKTLRFILFLFLKALSVILIAVLCFYAFRTALNTMDINTVVKDAFELRASVILKPLDNSDKGLLEGVFTKDYLYRSGLQVQDTNKSYTIQSYNQNTVVEFKIAGPFAKKAKVRVTDIVEDIYSHIVKDDSDDFVEVDQLMESGVYEVSLIKSGDNWFIDDIVLEKEITEEDPVPVPTAQPEKSKPVDRETESEEENPESFVETEEEDEE